MTTRNYKADEMEQFNTRIQNASSETQTQQSAETFGLWEVVIYETVIYEGDSPSLATVERACMGETTGKIRAITEAQAAKLLGR